MISWATQTIQQSALRWIDLVRAHDVDLYRHSIGVYQLTATFCIYLGLPLVQRHEFTLGALLHDVGKITIPSELLHKPSDLTPIEQDRVRTHPEIGYAMLEAEGCYSPTVLSIARDHHERLDGTGYPQRLGGITISEGVRIVTLCDIYAALTEGRSYLIPLRWNDALECMATEHAGLDLELLMHFADMIEAIPHGQVLSGTGHQKPVDLAGRSI